MKKLVLVIVLFTIFLDIFNLGLIYPIFTSLVFEGNGGLVPPDSSEFYKNAIFGVLISLFPFGQFLGAPIIGQFSDHFGRRKLLIITLMGTVITLLICAFGLYFSSFLALFLGRFIGGLMAGNMTLAYASIADLSSEQEKVKNFALIPLVTGIGFAFGPYIAGELANPDFHSLAGPGLPFILAAAMSLLNLLLVVWKFPDTFTPKKEIDVVKGYISSALNLLKAFRNPHVRPYLIIFFFMLSSNLLFVQFVGPFAISRFNLGITEVGYLYTNLGISVALGHLFLTRRLADHFSSERSLVYSLTSLCGLLIVLLFSNSVIMVHVLTFLIMLACAVAYTNSMALISNRASKDQQGEIMGVAVAVQSCSEFLPAIFMGLVAFLSQSIPVMVAAALAFLSYAVLTSRKEVGSKSESQI